MIRPEHSDKNVLCQLFGLPYRNEGERNVSNGLLHGWAEIGGGGGMPTAFLSTSVPPLFRPVVRVRGCSDRGRRRLWRTNAGTRERAITARGKVKDVRQGFSNHEMTLLSSIHSCPSRGELQEILRQVLQSIEICIIQINTDFPSTNGCPVRIPGSNVL